MMRRGQKFTVADFSGGDRSIVPIPSIEEGKKTVNKMPRQPSTQKSLGMHNVQEEDEVPKKCPNGTAYSITCNAS